MFCFYRWLLFCLCILYLPTSSLYVQYLIYDMGDRVHLIAQPWNWNSKLNGLITFTLYYKKPVKMCKQRSVTQFLQLQSLESNSCRNKPFFKTAKNTIGSSYRIPCGFGFQTWFEPLGPRVYSLLLPYDPLTIACLHKLYWVWEAFDNVWLAPTLPRPRFLSRPLLLSHVQSWKKIIVILITGLLHFLTLGFVKKSRNGQCSSPMIVKSMN